MSELWHIQLRDHLTTHQQNFDVTVEILPLVLLKVYNIRSRVPSLEAPQLSRRIYPDPFLTRIGV
jgi:hypothetical protein